MSEDAAPVLRLRIIKPILGQGSLYHLTFVSLVRLSPATSPLTFVTLVTVCRLVLTSFQAYVQTLEGYFMAKRPTPIERAIAGEPVDRQERYRLNVSKRGFVRVTVMIPQGRADELRALAADWRDRSSRDDD